MKVVFSIVSHGQRQMIDQLLSSLDEYLQFDGINLKIIVRDNLSENLDFNKSNLDIKVVENRKQCGFGANHNLTFCEFPCDYFFILNPDLLFIENFNLEEVISRVGDNVYAPTLLDVTGSKHVNFRAYPSLINLLRRRFGFKESPREHGGWVSGAFMALKWKHFANVGGFDENFYMYVEDCDLCYRLQHYGCNIVVDELLNVIHYAQKSSHHNIRAFSWHVRSLLYLWFKQGVTRILKTKCGKYIN